MEAKEHIEALQREGELLAAAAASAGLDAAVPTCPEWQVRDLVGHTGGVHRWAAANVSLAQDEPMGAAEMAEVMRTPEDGALVDWFREGHAALVETLATAPDDLRCWTFMPAPSPLQFWARRQAHETAIHRVDAESAAGSVSGSDADFAADGVDELLTGFLPRRSGRFTADPQRTLLVQAVDTGREWLATVGPERIDVARSGGAADCTVRGPAADLYLLLWNRRTPDGLDVSGDRGFLDVWRDSVHVRW
jgi:uncharacterized protein (TIGR03083 family)